MSTEQKRKICYHCRWARDHKFGSARDGSGQGQLISIKCALSGKVVPMEMVGCIHFNDENVYLVDTSQKKETEQDQFNWY